MALISSVFSCFFCKHEKPAARGRTRGSRNKKPGAACRPGAGVVSGVVSVNIFFWKILVTRVKRKIELPLSPSIGTRSRLRPRGWLTRYLALRRGQSGMQRCDHLRALADGRGHALDRGRAHVPNRKNPVPAGLQRIAGFIAVSAGQYEALGVQCDARSRQPAGVRICPDEQKKVLNEPAHFLS